MCPGNVHSFLIVIAVIPALAQPSQWTEAIEQGKALQNQHRFSEAEIQFRAAVQAAERLRDFAPEYAKRQAVALYYLASVEEDLGKMDSAAEFCNRAIAILSRVAGESDPDLQSIRIELADIYLQANQLSTAEKLLRQTLSAQSQAGQTRSLTAGLAWDALGALYAHQKKLDASEDAARRAVGILDELKLPDAKAVATAHMDYAIILSRRGHHAEALAETERTAEMARSSQGIPPLLESTILANLAFLYAEDQRTEAADEASQEAIDLVARIYGPDHFSCGWLWLARGEVLRKLHRQPEAKEAERRGHKILGASNLPGIANTVPFSTLLPAR